MSLFRVEIDADGNRTEIPQSACRDSYGNILVLDVGQTIPDGYEVFIPDGRPTYQQALSELNRVYQADIESMKQAFSLAYLADGVSQDAKQSSIRGQYESRKALHVSNIASLKSEYGAGV